MPQSPTLLEQLLPLYDARAAYERVLPASPQAVWEALMDTPLNEVRLVGVLMGIRTLPRLLSGGKTRGGNPGLPALQAMERSGFVRLGEVPGQEVVVGAIGKFWKLAENHPVKLQDRVAFLQFVEPGYAKAVMNFRLVPEVGGTRLITETRIAGTDPASARAFKRYWMLIRLGSGAIRRSWLAAIARRLKARQARLPAA